MSSRRSIGGTFNVTTVTDGTNGTNAFSVNLSNEMDSVACDSDMKTAAAFNIYSKIAAFYGVDNVTASCQIRYTSKPTNASLTLETSGSGTGSTALTTTFQTISTKQWIRIHYNSGVAVSKRETLELEIKHATYGTLSLSLAVVGTKGGAIYNLVPSANAITHKKDGTYAPNVITCNSSKLDVATGTTSNNPSEATIKYSADGGSVTNYPSGGLTAGTNFSNYVTFFLYLGNTVVDKETVNIVTDGDKGDDGSRGKAGRFFYFAGDWSSSTSYTMTDTQAPYVKQGSTFYMLDNAGNGGTNVTSANQDPSNASYGNGKPWTVMMSDMKYYIAEAYFGNYAHFASAIITGDYLISQYVDALGFGGMSMQLDDNSKYIYVDTDDMFGEDSMYEDLTKFPINESYASSLKEITSTSYSSNPYTSQFNLKWAGGWYCVDIRYLSAGGDLEFAIATSASATPIYEGTLQQFYTDESIYNQGFFMFPCTPKSSKYRVYFRKTSSDQAASGEIYWVKIRQAKFVPRLCQDMKSGKIATRDIIAKGELHAESFYYETILGGGNNNVYIIENESIVALAYNSMGSKIILPNPENAKGRVIEIYSGIQDGTDYWFKLGYEAATSSTYFRNAIGGSGSGNYAKANYSVQWKSSYIKLWCNGESWYVLKDEHTVWVNDSYGYRICLNNKIHV